LFFVKPDQNNMNGDSTERTAAGKANACPLPKAPDANRVKNRIATSKREALGKIAIMQTRLKHQFPGPYKIAN
jgi:hypothetical protein